MKNGLTVMVKPLLFIKKGDEMMTKSLFGVKR
ncbi:hypothetical protein DE167_006214 [Clostridium beijerinckii]|uniref:Uncharacterized protein n=1 Tax=Clostridium beijerinckii TaxID=1520 RepID=A0AAX0BAT0_CLOBE|nr:hypothetical protein [Clostridium beijerinckii]NYC75606.1 hypothetical protein [Clostridium beijerinckii]